MVEGWTIVSERAALDTAGPNPEVVEDDGVTFAYSGAAVVIIVDAGDRPQGNAIRNADTLMLPGPLPDMVGRWMDTSPTLLGFIRKADGCMALGQLDMAKSTHSWGNWPATLELGSVTSAELTWREKLPVELLDEVLPAPPLPVPGIDWLDDVPRDPVGALRVFLNAWYADLPRPVGAARPPSMKLPAALLSFHAVAAGREEILGREDCLVALDGIEYDEDGPGVVIATESQGVWWAAIDPTEDDPVVWYYGVPDLVPERERLSGFLLGFSLTEAAAGSPFTGYALVTRDVLAWFVEDLTPVPMQPMRIPGDPTRHWVAPGLVAMAAAHGDDRFWLTIGSRQRSALRPLHNRLDWERFVG